jgi:hypothetical protein
MRRRTQPLILGLNREALLPRSGQRTARDRPRARRVTVHPHERHERGESAHCRSAGRGAPFISLRDKDDNELLLHFWKG